MSNIFNAVIKEDFLLEELTTMLVEDRINFPQDLLIYSIENDMIYCKNNDLKLAFYNYEIESSEEGGNINMHNFKLDYVGDHDEYDYFFALHSPNMADFELNARAHPPNNYYEFDAQKVEMRKGDEKNIIQIGMVFEQELPWEFYLLTEYRPFLRQVLFQNLFKKNDYLISNIDSFKKDLRLGSYNMISLEDFMEEEKGITVIKQKHLIKNPSLCINSVYDIY